MRRLAAASVILLVSFGVAVADEFYASISKVDGNKVTFTKLVKKGDPKPEAMTLDVADNVKVSKGTKAKGGKVEVGDAIQGGLKADVFGKIDEKKGLTAHITTEGNKITQIVVTQKKKAAN